MCLRYMLGWRDLAEIPRPGNTGTLQEARQNKWLLKHLDGAWAGLIQFIPQRTLLRGHGKEKWHTCLSTDVRLRAGGKEEVDPPRWADLSPAACPLLSHEPDSRNENSTGAAAVGGEWWLGKGFGNWNLWGFLATINRGEVPILET